MKQVENGRENPRENWVWREWLCLVGRKKDCCEDKKDLSFPPCVFDIEDEK